MKKNKYSKIIIWGYPFGTHTHSFIHSSYFRAFKHLGYETYWLPDETPPKDLDFSNSLFIGEGFADKNIPINSTSCYFIMYCPDPQKYEQAEQYFDVRMAAENFKDHIQEYSLDKSKATKIGPGCYFEAKENKTIRLKNNYHDKEIKDYNRVYISWATNLLPHEFNFDWVDIKREMEINFCGSISSDGICENLSNIAPFIRECQKNKVRFIHHNPWSSPLSDAEVIRLSQRSLLGVDIRGPEHLKNKILTCRTFKNISYGHVGLTNSEAMYEALEGLCIFRENSADLFYAGVAAGNNKKLCISGMKFVQRNHTYINRVNSFLSII